MEAPVKPAPAPRRRAARAYLILGAVASLVAILWFAHRWWTAGQESTDDAQIEADIVPISARVGGTVVVARVHDHQAVRHGEVLFEIDPADLDIAIARSEAELEAARAQLADADAKVAIVRSSSRGGLSSARAAVVGAGASLRATGDSVRAAEASVARARADLAQVEVELGRVQTLFDRQAVTQQELDQARHAREVASAALAAASAQLDAARDQRQLAQARVVEAEGHVVQSTPVDQQVAAAEAAQKLAASRVKAAEAAVSKAKLDRSHATVIAPIDGVVSRLGVRAGQTVTPGQTMLMLVPHETFVIANFKETQIARMHPGDKVDIEIDAFEGSYEGVIETLSPATGAKFSLIPANNATGNFVKVVQRVPVKITWTKAPSVPVRPGLSVEVTAHVSH